MGIIDVSSQEEDKLEPIELARKIVDILADAKGEDVLLLDIQDITVTTDYFILCNAASERQLGALRSTVREDLKQDTETLPLRIEGTSSSGWILMDYGSVVVHLFIPELRVFYDLEELWRDGRVVVRIQ
ncbi:MAG: ribosome silencing factor [Anaerolineae bacterium]